jgi:hypothetical protein
MIELTGLLPAGEQGWLLLAELAEERHDNWLLIGGQMAYLLALEHNMALPRATADMDVVVDVRAIQGGTQWLAQWLVDRGFDQDQPSADGLSHRFSRPIPGGQGTVIFDVLGPEGLKPTTDLTTIPPGRTVEVPGANQALVRSRLVEVGIPQAGGQMRIGWVPCPDLLGGLVLKAAAVSEIKTRVGDTNRDWQDAALMLAAIRDPIAVAAELRKKDRQRLRKLEPLLDREHAGWRGQSDDAHRDGSTALAFLLG